LTSPALPCLALQMVFFVMMVIKGMSYALNNPTKEILYQVGTVRLTHA
jgi:hypothetical protein